MTKRMRIISLRVPEDIYSYYNSCNNSSEAMRYALVTYAAKHDKDIADKYGSDEQYELPLAVE